MAKKEDIKEYGVDLEKKYKDTQAKLISLENKIRKRAKLLCKLSPSTKINQTTVAGYYYEHFNAKDGLNNLSIDSLLYIIKKIETDYISKSRQTELFDDNVQS